ncbi:hypothetical protein HMPREF2532_00149 [Bacteroides ovatus]|nr:hypothetical protein BSCG_00250 [Bacteroides sp. 2_2_4]EFI41082.1 conserved hypothetical protein [Bacteroides sp. 3_1_23]KXT52657.1 hypothetical protein HMPREF2532_00149 [Bacteroides ovatus]
MQEDGIKASIKNERFMIGEITCAINRVEEQIEQLFDEKEEFIMAYEDALPRTMYLKKLTEIDSRIDELKKTLISLNEEKQEILDME